MEVAKSPWELGRGTRQRRGGGNGKQIILSFQDVKGLGGFFHVSNLFILQFLFSFSLNHKVVQFIHCKGIKGKSSPFRKESSHGKYGKCGFLRNRK